jgi:tRNA-uridine 2-sulfurtransferase
VTIKKALVAMSGGVDSSAAAALMVERGYQTIGVTMKLLARGNTGFGCCGSPADVDDAKRVCETLGIAHYVVDMAEVFADKVIRPFIDSYLAAKTPNPCVECNRSLKFGHLLGLSEAWGIDAVATGHYARVEGGRLLRARDEAKDQTYFLYAMTRRELAKTSFPVGDLTKAEVRAVARRLGLTTADKPESQEICFVPGRDYRAFVEAGASAGSPALEPGPIRHTGGKTLGRHDGLAGFTVGQRKGLGVTSPEPLYVVALEPETNTLVVGSDEETRRPSCRVSMLSWTGDARTEPFAASVRIRHRHAPAPADVSPRGDGTADVVFREPQRAVTPGQSAVFYDGDVVLGGGVIA